MTVACRQRFLELTNIFTLAQNNKTFFLDYCKCSSSIVYIQEDWGEILWRFVQQRGIPDPLGEIFHVRKVVIALHVFVWWLIVGIALLESHSSFNFSCLFVAKPSKVDLN